ncbi:MAG: transposase family protein [Alphaproteobacteria bacterium]|nr:transposase family protein [Alphaproteobacteria bacterium]
MESSKPGELLSQDTFLVGNFKGIGKVYLHAVVDTFSSFAFGSLQSSKRPEAAVAVLHNEVIPFYKQNRIPIRTVLTDNGREYCGTEAHGFQIFLELHEIEHRTTRVKRPQSNGFVERFNRTVLDEFFRLTLRKKMYKTIESLQTDLDTWLEEYNYRRPHLGYRNHGRKPWETITLFLKKK